MFNNPSNNFAARMQSARVVGRGVGGLMSQRLTAAGPVAGYNDAQSTIVASRQTVATTAATSSTIGSAEFDAARSVQPAADGKKPVVSAAVGAKFKKYNGDLDALNLKISRLSQVRDLYAAGLRQPVDIGIIPARPLAPKQRAAITKKSVAAASVVAPVAEISAASELQGITPESDGFKSALYDGLGLVQSNKNVVVNEKQAALNAAALSVTPGEVAAAVTSQQGAGSGLLNALSAGGVQSVTTPFEQAAPVETAEEGGSSAGLPVPVAPVLFKRSGAKRK